MNSLSDKNFDTKLDQLLTESVSPGAEPSGFTVDLMPERPRFNWVLFGGAAVFITLVGVILFNMILRQSVPEAAASSASAQGLLIGLSEWISFGVERLVSPDYLIYTAIVMALVYYMFASRMIRVFRLY